MKLLLLPLLLLVLVCNCVAQVKSEYDRFDNTTTVSTRERYVARYLQFNAYFTYVGQDLAQAKPKLIALRFKSSSRSWRFLELDSLIMIVDGERIVFDKPMWKDSRLGRRVGVEETLLFECSVDRARKIVGGKKVEVRVGVIEFAFGEDLTKDLKSLLEVLPK